MALLALVALPGLLELLESLALPEPVVLELVALPEPKWAALSGLVASLGPLASLESPGPLELGVRTSLVTDNVL